MTSLAEALPSRPCPGPAPHLGRPPFVNETPLGTRFQTLGRGNSGAESRPAWPRDRETQPANLRGQLGRAIGQAPPPRPLGFRMDSNITWPGRPEPSVLPSAHDLIRTVSCAPSTAAEPWQRAGVRPRTRDGTALPPLGAPERHPRTPGSSGREMSVPLVSQLPGAHGSGDAFGWQGFRHVSCLPRPRVQPPLRGKAEPGERSLGEAMVASPRKLP